jgi:DDE superfamily endonuclease
MSPLCEHVGSLFDYVDRHDNHSHGTYPLAHNPVTSLSVSGPVRFPLGLRLYRRYEELTPWEAAVAKHFPEIPIPREQQARNRLHTQVDPVLLQDPECRARHEQFQTKIALAIDLVEEAIGSKVSFGVVVFDAWYLAEDLIQVLARRRKDWISLLTKNRLLETASFQLRDVNGWALKLPGPHIAVAELVPLIPVNAYRPVTVSGHTSWCFTLRVRIPGLGKVRLVMSFEDEALTGRSVVLVTNRVDWSAAKIIGLYLQRWPTEIV